MSPFFSIIIPVYNVTPYLRECLDSILTQIFTDWEAICVDDGSTDGSGTILDEYAARDSRFRVIHQPNVGVSVARNAALKEAKGEWVWFIDSDDTIKPYALMRFVNYEYKADITYFGMDFVYEDGCKKTVCYRGVDGETIDETTSEEFLKMVSNSMGVDFFGYTWNKFFRTEIIQKNKISFMANIALWEDALFILEFLNYAQTFAVLHESLYEYRQHANSLTKLTNKPFYEVGKIFERSIAGAKFLPIRKLAYDKALLCYENMTHSKGKLCSVKSIVLLYRKHPELAGNGFRFKILRVLSNTPLWFAVIAYIFLRTANHVGRLIFAELK